MMKPALKKLMYPTHLSACVVHILNQNLVLMLIETGHCFNLHDHIMKMSSSALRSANSRGASKTDLKVFILVEQAPRIASMPAAIERGSAIIRQSRYGPWRNPGDFSVIL